MPFLPAVPLASQSFDAPVLVGSPIKYACVLRTCYARTMSARAVRTHAVRVGFSISVQPVGRAAGHGIDYHPEIACGPRLAQPIAAQLVRLGADAVFLWLSLDLIPVACPLTWQKGVWQMHCQQTQGRGCAPARRKRACWAIAGPCARGWDGRQAALAAAASALNGSNAIQLPCNLVTL